MKTVPIETPDPKSKQKTNSNYSLYFYTFLTINLIAVIVNSYLPIYFYNVLNVDRTQLAFAQIISYSALFIKPVISIYFDRNPRLKFPIRLLLVGIGVGILLSFIAFILSIPILIIFGIFLGINFAFTSVIDVIIKKVLIKKSDTEKEKNRNVLYFQAGSLIGAFLPPILSILLPWSMFFISSIIIVAPLIIVLAFLGKPEYAPDKEKLTTDTFKAEFSFKNIALVCIFTFLIYADQLYQYPLEPYLVDFMGQLLFNIVFMIFLLINTIGIIFAGIISHRWNKKKILVYNTILTGLLLLLTPFVPLFIFLFIYAVLMIVGGFIIVNLISLLIDVSKERITIYQTIAVFVVIAKIVLVPLGTGLSEFLASEWIIFIAGILFLLALIPLYFIQTSPTQNQNSDIRQD
ncbi:MAG: MFS transporter [Promethearchaeota archaeon]|nr:MAG: MFS transporter [Candidatus Lokiarchaeota archaeon]